MNRFFLLLSSLYFLNSFAQSKVEMHWSDYPEKAKKIKLLGDLEDKSIISYINKDKKVAIRTYTNDLAKYEDVVLEIPISNKETFYQKSLILDNKLVHFVSSINKNENRFELFAYVQKSLKSNEFEKIIVANNYLGKIKYWAANLEFFSEFDIETSDNGAKLLIQPKDYASELIFRMEEKTLSVYNSNDLTKKMSSYTYAPERLYFRNNGIKISNDGEIFKSDIYKLENFKTRKKTEDITRILNCKSDKVSESIVHNSESSPSISLDFLKFKNDFYVGAVKNNKEKKTFQLVTEIYESKKFAKKDSLEIALNDLKLPFNLTNCALLSMHIDSKSNIIYTLQNSEFSGGYLIFYNIFIISIDKEKQFKFLGAFPIKATIQSKFSDDYFVSKTLNINFHNDQLSFLYRDFTINEKAMIYDEYRKFDKDSELESIFMLNFNSNGFVNKIKLLEDETLKKNINHKVAKFIGNNKLQVYESKNDKIGVILFN